MIRLGHDTAAPLHWATSISAARHADLPVKLNFQLILYIYLPSRGSLTLPKCDFGSIMFVLVITDIELHYETHFCLVRACVIYNLEEAYTQQLAFSCAIYFVVLK